MQSIANTTKTSQTEKGWIVEKMIVEFPAKQWRWHMLVDTNN